MRRGSALLLLSVLLSAGVAWGHYPLLETVDPMVDQGDVVEIEYSNGHPFAQDRYTVPKPEQVGVYEPGRVKLKDLIARVTSATVGERTVWRLKHRPRKSGDHIYSWHCGMLFEKPARRVEDYAKLVIHVADGEHSGAQVGWDRAVGDPMEIVPLTRPYAVPVGGVFRAKVLLGGKPFANGNAEAETYPPAGVDPHLTYLPNARLNVKTDPNGVFAMTLKQAGWWLFSCATDGGPGEQGQERGVVQRATFWVYVGGTVWDRE